MRNKEDFIEKMKERGYSRVSETRNSKNEIISIHFIYNNLTDENKKRRISIPAYAVDVWPETEEFQLFYSLSSSISILSTRKCGVFFNDEHFDRIAIKFELEINPTAIPLSLADGSRSAIYNICLI